MLHSFLESDAAKSPYEQFAKWWADAERSKIDEFNAMVLATSSKEGSPSARVVLLKDFNEEGFIFYTNYNSRKGREILSNPNACLIFFWKELERQIRIEGIVEKVDEKTSDEYFNSRPRGSKIGAWASPQSEVITGREMIEKNALSYQQKFNDATTIPRPAAWGGYIVKPAVVEFWQGRPDRLHDRILYSRQKDKSWKTERLAP